ncbi:Calpain-8 [Aphelenchoides fujianensis]|nr:Calpain-8 [Aphelenchoides fujianensis]
MLRIIIVRRRPNVKPEVQRKQRLRRAHKRRQFTKAFPKYPNRRPKPLDFETEKRRCLRSQRLFEDPEYPPEVAIPVHPVAEWRRPGKIVPKPEFYDGRTSRHDIQQTILGDCFFLAPLSLIADREELISKVVPKSQGFGADYAGIFRFRFWQYGEWLEIIIGNPPFTHSFFQALLVVDDRLPVNVFTKKLKFTRSRQYHHFWVPLVEKAYSKLYGGYANIHGGHAAFSMQNLTGGISIFNLWRDRSPRELAKAYEKLLVEFQLGVLLCAKSGSRKRIRNAEGEIVAVHSMGLMPNHAYSVTGVRVVETQDGRRHRLLRIRNPWGRVEWTGAWAAGAAEWAKVRDPKVRRELHDRELNGEWWMEWTDFVLFFKNVDRCYLGPETMVESENGKPATASSKCSFEYAPADGTWSNHWNTNGGGYPKGVTRGIFHRNPQYVVTIAANSKTIADAKGRVLVLWQVVQKYVREHGLAELLTGCVIYPLTAEEARQDKKFNLKFFQSRQPLNRITYSLLSSQRKKIPAGHFLFVPFCHRASGDGFFLLRNLRQRWTPIEGAF